MYVLEHPRQKSSDQLSRPDSPGASPSELAVEWSMNVELAGEDRHLSLFPLCLIRNDIKLIMTSSAATPFPFTFDIPVPRPIQQQAATFLGPQAAVSQTVAQPWMASSSKARPRPVDAKKQQQRRKRSAECSKQYRGEAKVYTELLEKVVGMAAPAFLHVMKETKSVRSEMMRVACAAASQELGQDVTAEPTRFVQSFNGSLMAQMMGSSDEEAGVEAPVAMTATMLSPFLSPPSTTEAVFPATEWDAATLSTDPMLMSGDDTATTTTTTTTTTTAAATDPTPERPSLPAGFQKEYSELCNKYFFEWMCDPNSKAEDLEALMQMDDPKDYMTAVWETFG
ncbi:hypothetical protein Tdes44962_MAKER08974 [Teratosphaeria destructans]|uniref:Uncharacterized protein n=1 Tax=Teratosphaeria destructans TaxID=418781 RepID=A0A9W7W413_9PEZI|nr:hypothetical protein Tdes44962_MAKER08974 [Teratosphaeria destructans]